MKKILLAYLCCFIAYSVTNNSGIKAQTLAHSYTFEDGTANDSPGGGYTAVNGTLNGGTITGGAYVASANGNYISFSGSGLALNTYSSGITLEAYIKAGSTGANNGASWTYLASFGLNTNGLMMAVTRWDNTSCAGFLGTGGATLTGPKIDDSNLHHLVTVLTASSISLYIDGNLINSAATTKAISSLDISTAYLCKSLWNDPTWLGSVYEFNIYQGAMSAATIKSHASTFITPLNPTKTHSYTFESLLSGTNGVSGATIQDMVGTANGTINGGDWEVKNGAFCNHNSNQTSGSTMGGYVSFTGSAMGFSGYTGALTYEAYITTTNDENNPNKYSFIGYFGNASGANSYFLRPEKNGTAVTATYGNGSGTLTDAQGTTVMGAKETRHFIAVQKPSTTTTAGYIEIYMDGVLQKYTSLAANTFNTAVTGLGTALAYLGKGAWTDPLNTNLIHEFNIYNGEMNAGDVAARYAAMNTKLATLSVNAGTLSPIFNANIYNYGVVLPVGTTSLTVSATPASSNYSTVDGATTYDVSGAEYGTITLNVNTGSGTPYVINWRKDVSSPVLTHSYTFNGNANDEMGTANGTLSAGAAGKIANGVFTTTVGTNFGSGTSQYISIPGSTLAINTYPSLTMEAVVKSSSSGYIASFGSQNKVFESDYLNLKTTGSYISAYTYNNPWLGENTSTFTETADGKAHHLVTVLDNDNLITYVDGILKTNTAVSNVNKLFNLSNSVAYLCRSGYVSDANWVGSLGEYNIYKGKLDATTVASRSNAYLKDATLASVTLSVGSISFDANTTSYTITVPSGTTSVTVGATVTRDFATVIGAGTVTLDASGNGTAILNVTSADGTAQKVYTINFGVPNPTIVVSAATLSTLDEFTNRTFTVSGANLQGDINISAPTGFTVSSPTLTPSSGVVNPTAITVSYTGAGGANWSNINLTSNNATTKTVKVRAYYNGSCYSPTYSDKVNIISDPYVSRLSNYTLSWGSNVGLFQDTTTVYCGLNSAKVSGLRAGSLTYNLSGIWKSNTKYRLIAKVYTPTVGRFDLWVSGWSGSSADIGASLTNAALSYTSNVTGTGTGTITAGQWNTVDFTFVTGTFTSANQYFYFNNYASNVSGTSYIDNIELYEIERYVTGNENISTLTSSNGTNEELTVKAGNELTVDANSTLKSITVMPLGRLTLSSGKILNISGVTLQSDATGTATFVNSGTANVTTANVQQYLSSARNWYISSPLSNGTVPFGNTYYSYDETGSNTGYTSPASAYWVAKTAGSTMNVGKGYIAQPGSVSTVSFSGTLNDGNKIINLTRTAGKTKEGFNLVGNPYPSYLSWKSAYNDIDNQANANVGSTIWYRTKTTGGSYVFATYNASSNLGTLVETGDMATGNIPPMQAFWVRVSQGSSAGILTLKNSMRAHKGTQLQADGYTYNDAKLRLATIDNPSQVLRLQVSNRINSDEAIIIFDTNASNGLDTYDSYKMSNNNPDIPEIYTKAGLDNLVINGLNSIQTVNEMPLGFSSGKKDTFTIQATQLNNLEGVNVVLHDNILNTEQDLTAGDAYIFTSDATTTDTRFLLLFRTESITTGSKETLQNIHVYNNNGQIEVTCNDRFGSNDAVTVYNIEGQRIASKMLRNSKNIFENKLVAGIYIVSMQVNGEQRTVKVVVK